MLTTLASLALLMGAAAPPQTDTVVPVPAGARLSVDVMGGDIKIRTWNRNELRLVAQEAGDHFSVTTSGSVVRIEPEGRRGFSRGADMELTIPSSMSVELNGPFIEADIAGVEGEVTVETVQGDVTLVGGRRYVKLQSVQGNVRCENAQGRIELGSANGEVTVRNVAGDLVVEAVNGEIHISGADLETVEASTINGEISYAGALKDAGRYSFSAHNGDITVAVPPRTNTTVTVSTFNGEFEADFPVTLTETRTRGKRFSFVIGNGSGRLELDSFGGTIKLVRP